MKKYIGLAAMSMVMTVFITGCGSNEVKLGEYKGLEGEKIICEVTDEEVSEAIEDMLYDYISYDEVTDRAAQDGDLVNIDYVITKLDGKDYEPKTDDSDEEKDDETVDVESSDPYSGYDEEIVIGEEYIYPEVEKALIGMNKGDKKTVTAKLTDDYVDEDMVGKTADIEVTLNEISAENKPEYNDAFVKENLNYNTTAEYEVALKEQLLNEKEEEYKYDTVTELMEKIIDSSTFGGYDKQLYADCEEEYDAGNEQMASMYGMELSDYEAMIGIDDVTKKEDIISMVHERQVIEAIAKAEGIEVSDDDVDKFVEDVYAEYEYTSADEFIKEYGRDYIKSYLVSEKVYDFLFENAKLTEITEDEYNQRLEDEEGYVQPVKIEVSVIDLPSASPGNI